MNEKIYKTQAIVLRRYDFGEAGRQLVIYTPLYGKLSVIAQGVKRSTSKLAGHLEPLMLTSIVAVRGRNLDTVTSADTVEAFWRGRSEPDRMFHALLVAELLDKLTPERDENRAIWDLLVETLRRIDADPDPRLVTLHYEARLLVLSGYRPRLGECVVCDGPLDPNAVSYSARLGGTLCAGCRTADTQSFRIGASAVKLLRLAVNAPYAAYARVRAGEDVRREVERVLRYTSTGLAERTFESPALLEAMERYRPTDPATRLMSGP